MDSFSAATPLGGLQPSVLIGFFTASKSCCTTTQHNANAISCFDSSPSVSVRREVTSRCLPQRHSDSRLLLQYKVPRNRSNNQHPESLHRIRRIFNIFKDKPDLRRRARVRAQPRHRDRESVSTEPVWVTARSSRGGAQRGRESVSTEPISLQLPRLAIRIWNAHGTCFNIRLSLVLHLIFGWI